MVLWVWNLLFAAVIALPAWQWWYGSTAWSPEADIFLSRFSMGVMTELLRSSTALGVFFTTFLALALVAFVGQALVAGGTIAVLTSDDARPLLPRFFRGGGHFFWRFLRASIVGALVFAVGAVVVVAVAWPIGRVLGEVDWEPAWYLGQAMALTILALMALAVGLALDYARIRMAREDSRRALRAFVRGLAFVARHPRATLGVWLVVAVLTGVLFAVYFTCGEIVPAASTATILLMAVAQQTTMFVRAGLRVALVGAEVDVWGTYNPVVSSFELQVSSSDVTPQIAESAAPPASGAAGPEGP